MEKCAKGLPPLKRAKLSKKSQEKHDIIKDKLYESDRWWNYWKFKLHWNMLEWVDPKSTPKKFEFPIIPPPIRFIKFVFNKIIPLLCLFN